VRLATWNVNSVQARLPRLLDWLSAVGPDVLCLQETKCANTAFPGEPVADLGYEVLAHGEGRWNGVALLSRVGVRDASRGFAGQPAYAAPPPADDPALFAESGQPVVEARALSATCGGLRVWSVYVPNGRSVDSAHYRYKLAWLSGLRDAMQAETSAASAFAVCGDFNIAPSDDDVWDPAAFAEATHVTGPERAAYRSLLDLGLTDVPARALKGPPYTYWDYRAGCFHKGMGMRIDLVLGDGRFAGAVRDAYVDRDARKGKSPSDHAPVVVDLEL
jgi:exodeoxyribonuclease-3